MGRYEDDITPVHTAATTSVAEIEVPVKDRSWVFLVSIIDADN